VDGNDRQRLALAVLAIMVGLGSGISQPLSMVILAEHLHPDQRSAIP